MGLETISSSKKKNNQIFRSDSAIFILFVGWEMYFVFLVEKIKPHLKWSA